VTNALLVLPGANPGDPAMKAPTGEAAAALFPPLDPDPAAAWQAALEDPASTGGLLDAIANGDIAGQIGPGLQRELATFRAAGPFGGGGGR